MAQTNQPQPNNPSGAAAQPQPGTPADQSRTEASSQCARDVRGLEQQINQESSSQPWGSSMRQDILHLRDAAITLAQRGNEQACQAVLVEMREVHDNPSRGTAANQPADRTGTDSSREQQLAQAAPINQQHGMLQSGDIVGANVRNRENQDLGYIERLVVNPQNGTIAYVLVARGGFLGLGTEWVPVRWADLLITPDKDTYVLNVSRETLNNAPRVTRDALRGDDAQWRQQSDQYWQQHRAG